MLKIMTAPSILAADFTCLGAEIRDVLEGGADYLHIDVMDGIFVPNISLGVPVVASIRKAFPDAFLDVHLMITEPIRFIDPFCDAGADHLTFHLEADKPENIAPTLDRIRARGVKAGLSLKPGTPAEAMEPWLGDIDMVLVMTVEPGFGGQSFMYDQMPKVRQIRAMLNECNPSCDLEVDGGIAEDTAPIVLEAGANVLVAGSAVFGAEDRSEILKKIRNK